MSSNGASPPPKKNQGTWERRIKLFYLGLLFELDLGMGGNLGRGTSGNRREGGNWVNASHQPMNSFVFSLFLPYFNQTFFPKKKVAKCRDNLLISHKFPPIFGSWKDAAKKVQFSFFAFFDAEVSNLHSRRSDKHSPPPPPPCLRRSLLSKLLLPSHTHGEAKKKLFGGKKRKNPKCGI